MDEFLTTQKGAILTRCLQKSIDSGFWTFDKKEWYQQFNV